jgi:iron complex outermembrane receptor protein
VNPPLRPQDRAAVSDAATTVSNHYDAVTAQFDSRIFGQHLSYVGSYSIQHNKNFAEGANPSAGDVGNVLPGVVIAQDVTTRSVQTTHEIRLASDPAPGRWFDYTVGAYYSWFDHQGHIINPGTLLPGAFGPTPTPSLAAFNPAYQIPVFIDIPGTAQETSLFGSLTLHLPWNTELTGGIRHIWSVANDQTAISTGNGLLDLAAVGLPAGFPCSALAGAFPFPVTSAGGSNCALQSAGPQVSFANRVSDTPNIYNVSLSHHFTRDFLVYVNTGTAYRPSFVSVGLQGQIIAAPGLNTLGAHPAERSRMYEVGFKSTWFDGRARLNAAIYRQRFDNLPIFIPNVYYNNVAPGEVAAAAPGDAGVYAPTNFNMTESVNALVQGFDIDAALQITHDWNISAQFSYADGKVKGSSVPCNTFGADGRPVFNANGLISLCPGGSTSRQPLWSLTAQTEYVHPIGDDVDGFVRGLLNYYPENKRVEPDFKVPSYALVNVYAGVRSHDGAWEVSLFARNVFNTFRATDISPLDAGAPLSNPLADFPGLIHPTGYYETLTTMPREVGVNLHYAWGSR